MGTRDRQAYRSSVTAPSLDVSERYDHRLKKILTELEVDLAKEKISQDEYEKRLSDGLGTLQMVTGDDIVGIFSDVSKQERLNRVLKEVREKVRNGKVRKEKVADAEGFESAVKATNRIVKELNSRGVHTYQELFSEGAKFVRAFRTDLERVVAILNDMGFQESWSYNQDRWHIRQRLGKVEVEAHQAWEEVEIYVR